MPYHQGAQEGREIVWEVLDLMAVTPELCEVLFDTRYLADAAYIVSGSDPYWMNRPWAAHANYSRAQTVIAMAREQGWVELVYRGGRGRGANVYKLTPRGIRTITETS